jgi:hypothetical protein
MIVSLTDNAQMSWVSTLAKRELYCSGLKKLVSIYLYMYICTYLSTLASRSDCYAPGCRSR